MCISRLVQENGIPFSIKLSETEHNSGINVMRQSSVIALSIMGISYMSLYEIYAKIFEARSQHAK